ncbi:hypothetical protein BDQ12DRAFT_660917 [Crucibulum laeve]|uniref:F-box domain-containing protein n=1 Tax=Crucibulum laeve TaxID=68775 RepID=A0A5C3MFA5_9AGAR|nr:hypothetical protein BDQ12DRAFT_660917 [Crucibulum laeve]
MLPTVKSESPELPFELLRDIFELAIATTPGCAVKFALVSSTAQEWIESIIYKTIVLDLPVKKTKLFLQTLESRQPTFFAAKVKNLHVTTFVSFPEVQQILSVCTGLDNLTCWADVQPFNELRPLIPVNRLQKLSIKIETFWGISTGFRYFDAEMFPCLSHLEIVNPPCDDSSLKVDWEGLCKLPKLTHLAIGSLWAITHNHVVEVIRMLLEKSDTLQALLIISMDDDFIELVKEHGLRDNPRVVVMPTFDSFAETEAEYWKAVVQGGPDFWTAADKVVQKQTEEGYQENFIRK